MRFRAASILALALASSAALAAPLPALAPPAPFGLGGPDAAADLVGLTIEVDEGGRAAGDRVAGTVVARIAPEWHINSATPKDEFAIPTVLTLESPGIDVAPIAYPPHVERAFSFAGGELLAVYEHDLRIPFEGVRTRGGAISLVARLAYQACNDRVCLPPRTVEAAVEISAEGVAVAADPQVSAPAPAGEFTPLSEAPPAGGLLSGDVGATFARSGLPLTLAVVFLLGLALNLTPCVYPLIPLTVAFFSAQTEGRAMRRFGLASSYVLGLAAMYSALGVFSALSGQLFGAWLQRPGVLLFFAVLMLVLAASMFGAFEIRVPHFISDRAGGRSGFLGAATMGLLAGIVAAPCVGPFIISLIALVGQKGSVAFGFVLFFVLALGLGLPYLVLGMFSTALGSMPRSGAWMVQIKQALGFVLIAMAFYFLRPVLANDAIYRWGVGASLLAGAAFLLLRRGGAVRGAFAVRAISGVLLLAGGLYFVWPRHSGPEIQWQPYDRGALAAAAAANRPVVIDFYADWCLPCKELDEKTFNQPEVVAESERFVRLKADLTRTGDERVEALTREYGILGVPTIVFIDSRGREAESVRLTGFERPEPFLERMRRVR